LGFYAVVLQIHVIVAARVFIHDTFCKVCHFRSFVAANEKDGLAKRKLLGTFKQKGKTELTVTLEVPIELGNEHMNKLGIIPWTFIVEEIPEDTTPHTGDWYQSALWLSVAGLLLLAIVLVLLMKRRAREAK
jgi:hypothetical protein